MDDFSRKQIEVREEPEPVPDDEPRDKDEDDDVALEEEEEADATSQENTASSSKPLTTAAVRDQGKATSSTTSSIVDNDAAIELDGDFSDGDDEIAQEIELVSSDDSESSDSEGEVEEEEEEKQDVELPQDAAH